MARRRIRSAARSVESTRRGGDADELELSDSAERGAVVRLRPGSHARRTRRSAAHTLLVFRWRYLQQLPHAFLRLAAAALADLRHQPDRSSRGDARAGPGETVDAGRQQARHSGDVE